MARTSDAAARPARVAEQVVAKIEMKILGGQLAPGDRLPTEHALSETLSVSRSVVREALAKLKIDGLVESRQGSGMFVAERPGTSSFKLDHVARSGRQGLEQVFELRLIVEVAAAERAAERHSAADLAAMHQAFEAMQNALAAGLDGTDHDDAFHRAIANAADNPYLARFVSFVGAAFVDTRRPSWTRQGHAEGLATAAQAEHRLILDAIGAGDPDEAAVAARNHLMRSALRTGIHTAAGQKRRSSRSRSHRLTRAPKTLPRTPHS